MRRIFLLTMVCGSASAQNAPVTISVDTAAQRHAINPLIYGVAFASKADLAALNAPVNRSGGNSTTTYNWVANAQNLAQDYYFESYPGTGTTPASDVDAFITDTLADGAKAAVTIPLIGHVAKLGPGRTLLPSFSVKKYGAQCSVDPYDHDAGDGLRTDCSTPITGNAVSDSYIVDSFVREQNWVHHMALKFGHAAKGGVAYYLMDNEASIWFSTHRDVHPVGPHGTEYANDVIAMSAKIKAVDAGAKVVAPEEWGWEAYFYSGYDQQYAAAHGYCCFPDHAGVQGGVDYMPWLLGQWKAAGHPVDVVSVHFYPQGAEFSNDDSQATQLLRNRSTRQLWDKTYKSESWIGVPVYLIPRLRAWVNSAYYPGTPIAITEYNWGDEANINGATTQADLDGLFGKWELNMATRWTVPANTSPTFKAMQMYRNYDGNKSTFGETSVAASVPNPDDLSAFAGVRTADGALTVMVISKVLSGTTPITVKLAHFAAAGTAQVFRLTSSNAIQALPGIAWSGGVLADVAPAQSVTLYVLPKG